MKTLSKTTIRILVGIPIVLVLGTGAMLLVATSRSAGEEQREVSASREIGMPVEIADMRLAPVPNAENAAKIYGRILELLDGPLGGEQAVIDSQSGTQPSPELRDETNNALKALKPMFDLVSQLDRCKACNFGRDWSKADEIKFPEMVTLRYVVKDLCLKAGFQDRGGDWRGALNTMRLAHRVAVDAGSDPCMITLLVQVGLLSTVQHEYERLLSRHTRDLAFLNAAQTQISSESALPVQRKSLGGEVVIGRLTLAKLTTLRKFDADLDPDQPPPQPSFFERRFFQSSLVQHTIQAKYLTAWQIGWRDFPKDPDDWEAFERAIVHMGSVVNADKSFTNTVNLHSLFVIPTAGEFVGLLQAHNRLMLTSIQLLKVRIATGQLPSVLPSSLGKTRIDPFDGNPLRYRRTADGFVLYSIGRDRQDNGGKSREPGDFAVRNWDEVVEFK
jgi:hypothetical protein